MQSIDILMNEHRVIEKVLACLEVFTNQVEVSGQTDIGTARKMIDFFRQFADRCHHGKEEDRLFPLMEARGFDRETGPTGVMLSEHQQGRGYISYMLDALDAAEHGDKSAAQWFVTNAKGYIHLLRNHIYKEDHCLFPMAAQAMTPEDEKALLASFEEFEAREMKPETHEVYHQLAETLAEKFGV
jgi:hemerythrin-like domain-containing protein